MGSQREYANQKQIDFYPSCAYCSDHEYFYDQPIGLYLAHCTLHTAHEHAEAEARTGVENLTSLLEKSVSSSSQEIDLSLHSLQTYIEKELDNKKQIDNKDINLFIQKEKDWIGSVTQRLCCTNLSVKAFSAI